MKLNTSRRRFNTQKLCHKEVQNVTIKQTIKFVADTTTNVTMLQFQLQR